MVSAIRDAIIQGRLRPGEKVPEEDLAQQLGVSRTPVREAIRILEQQGLVMVRPKNGTFIAMVDRRDVADGLAVRVALEALAVQELTSRLSEGRWLALCNRLDGLLRRMDEAVRTTDAAAATELDIEFHTTLIKAADNRYLAKTWRLVGIPMLIWSPEREMYPQSQAEMRVGLTDRHAALLAAIRTRDPETGAAAVRQHIEQKLADIDERSPIDGPSGGRGRQLGPVE